MFVIRKPFSNKAFSYLGLLFTLGVIASVYMRRVLPAKYFYDDNRMRGKFDSEYWLLFQSDINTVAVYDFLGFNEYTSPILIGIFGIFVGFVAFRLALARSPMVKLDFPAMLFFGMCFALLVIFYGQLSKEVILTIITTSCFLLVKNFKGIVIALLILCIYAAFFRIYWFLIISLTIANLFFLSGRITRRSFAFLLLSILFAMSFVFYQTQGYYLSEIRTVLNRGSIGSPDVITIILNLFPTTNVGLDVLNGLISSLRFKFPLELVALGNVKYLAFIVFQLWLTTVVYQAVKFYFSTPQDKGLRYKFSLSIIIAYWLIQGFFEPDFGTALRHQFPLLPFFIYLFFCNRVLASDQNS